MKYRLAACRDFADRQQIPEILLNYV